MTLIGKAWRGVQRFVQDIRIDAEFPRYESAQGEVHASEANRRFDTSQLEREIDEIQLAAEAEGLAAFGAHIHVAESSINALRPAISLLRGRLELLICDYGRELNQLDREKANLLDAKQPLFEAMKALQKQRSEAQDELRESYDNLNEAKSAIDNWYAKSERTPWLFGNGGKRLPDRSIFGQSFGDLDGYKADRARVSEEIGSCKAAVARIAGEQKANASRLDENKTALNRAFECIKAVKAARQRMFDLKDQGVRRHQVEAELSDHLRQETAALKDLDRYSKAMVEHVVQQSFRMGMEERRRGVDDLSLKRAQFLAAFDDPVRRAERQRAHREWWLKTREAY